MINRVLSSLIISSLLLFGEPSICKEKNEDLFEIMRIEQYLNEITTLKSSFIQISNNGERLDGELFISRPGRMRVQYEAPSPILLVANDSYLAYVDSELEEVSYIPIS